MAEILVRKSPTREAPQPGTVVRKIPTKVEITGIKIPIGDLMIITSKIMVVVTVFLFGIITTTATIGSYIVKRQLSAEIKALHDFTNSSEFKESSKRLDEESIRLEEEIKRLEEEIRIKMGK